MEHSDGEWTKYFHLAQGSAQNARNNLNSWVTAGTVLATQGDIGYTCGGGRAGTGCSGYYGGNCGTHVHFEVRYGRYGEYRTPRFCGVPGETVQTGQTYTASSCDGSGDTTPPDGDITSPSEGATITSRTVHLAGWAQDNSGGSGLQKAHFTAYYNGSWRQVGPDFTSSPFSFDWDMCNDGVPDGQVTLGLDIWDNAGNAAYSPRGNRHFTKSYNCTQPPQVCPAPGRTNLRWLSAVVALGEVPIAMRGVSCVAGIIPDV